MLRDLPNHRKERSRSVALLRSQGIVYSGEASRLGIRDDAHALRVISVILPQHGEPGGRPFTPCDLDRRRLHGCSSFHRRCLGLD